MFLHGPRFPHQRDAMSKNTKIQIQSAFSDDDRTRLAALKQLTGCPLAYVVDGTCAEPGCPNSDIAGEQPLDPRQACKFLAQLLTADFRPQANSAPPEPIIDTQPRMRCVL